MKPSTIPFFSGLRRAIAPRPVVTTRPGKGREPLGAHLEALSATLERCSIADLEAEPLRADLREYRGSSRLYLDSQELEGACPVAALRRWAKERLPGLDAPLELRFDVASGARFDAALERAAARLVALFEEILSVSGFCRGLQGIAVEARAEGSRLVAGLEILGSCMPRKMLELEERGFGIVMQEAAASSGLNARAVGRQGMARVSVELEGAWA